VTVGYATIAGVDALGLRVRDALIAWCNVPVWCSVDITAADSEPTARQAFDTDAFVADMFRDQSVQLVRLARLFVDDRTAAEDLVQEAFIRLARSAHRIEDRARAPAYLRSIVVNLARDHNRRGLVSMRHRLPLGNQLAGADDQLVLEEDQREVLEALSELPGRQRTCLVLRYYDELGIDEIAATIGVSRNSVKTHLQRGLAALQQRLAQEVLQ
jgi:RNA polymerase sigma factor (sigma-70 family)